MHQKLVTRCTSVRYVCFSMRVWPWIGWFLKKVSVITRSPLYSMSAIDRFDCICFKNNAQIPFSVPKHFWELASYVSLNFVYLICRKRDFPVKAKTFSDFQYFLTYARPFNGIFSYSKIEIPGIYMFKVDKNCRRGAYFTEFLMFLLLTLNIIFPSDIYILYVNVRWEYSALQQKSLCFYSSLLGYSKK